MGKHSGQQDSNENLQAMADDFDSAQAAIDARVEENKTDYPAIQNYEQNQNKK